MLLEPEINDETFKGTFLAYKYLGSLFGGKDRIYRIYSNKIGAEIQKYKKKTKTLEETKSRVIQLIREFRFLHPTEYSGSSELKIRLLNLLHAGKLYDENGEKYELYPKLTKEEFLEHRPLPGNGEKYKSIDALNSKFDWLLDRKHNSVKPEDYAKYFTCIWIKGKHWELSNVELLKCIEKFDTDYEKLSTQFIAK